MSFNSLSFLAQCQELLALQQQIQLAAVAAANYFNQQASGTPPPTPTISHNFSSPPSCPTTSTSSINSADSCLARTAINLAQQPTTLMSTATGPDNNGNDSSKYLWSQYETAIEAAISKPPLQQTTTTSTKPPTVPSSSLLAKLSSVTARQNPNVIATKLDYRMLDFMEALYCINDNPEPAAIEMIARRLNVSVDIISDWFDQKRLKLNPQAGPRSPPAKKRAGGRVVTFSEYQRSLLEAIFDENNYLHPQEYEELSNLIQVPSRNIKIWFKNRRSKQRLSGRVIV